MNIQEKQSRTMYQEKSAHKDSLNPYDSIYSSMNEQDMMKTNGFEDQYINPPLSTTDQI